MKKQEKGSSKAGATLGKIVPASAKDMKPGMKRMLEIMLSLKGKKQDAFIRREDIHLRAIQEEVKGDPMNHLFNLWKGKYIAFEGDHECKCRETPNKYKFKESYVKSAESTSGECYGLTEKGIRAAKETD